MDNKDGEIDTVATTKTKVNKGQGMMEPVQPLFFVGFYSAFSILSI